MEHRQDDDGLLRDLALIYVAMAHAPDHQLENRELDLIADRLRRRQEHAARETVLGALKAALDTYVAPNAGRHLERAIRRLGTACSEELRQALLDDLVAVALADDLFTQEEARFLGTLARAWGVHPTAAQEDPRWWNVFDAPADARTAIQALALIYLALAHAPDHHIADAELEAITRKIREWLPATPDVDVMTVVQEALRTYAREPGDLAHAVAVVRQAVPTHQHPALLADLRYIACADGVMLVEERALIARLAEALGLAPDA